MLRWGTTAVAALLLCSAPISAQTLADSLDAYMSARARLGQFNGSVLVARSGKVVLEKGYGLANIEHRTPATMTTRYQVASITKNFTAAAILRLQETGRLRLTDSLCTFVAPCPDAWRPVTIAHLLHHTSGIPDYEEALELGSPAYLDYMLQARSADRIVDAARAKPLEFVPGVKFAYSNTAYILLSRIVERASGQSYQDFLRAQLFAPAKLRDLAFVSGRTIVPHVASGYTRRELDFATLQAGITLDERTVDRMPWLPLDGAHGDANLLATPRDLWQWTRALRDSSVLSPASVRYMFTPGLANYGAGWFIGSRFEQRTLSHTGLLPGFASVIEWYPDTDALVVLMANVDGIRLSTTQRDLGAILFGKPYDVPVARTLIAYDSTAIAPLVGEYALDDGGTAIVTAEKTMLSVQVRGRFTAGAFPMGRDTFYAPFFDNTVRFDRAAGTIALRINGVTLAGKRR